MSDARCAAGKRGDRPGSWSTCQAARRLNDSCRAGDRGSGGGRPTHTVTRATGVATEEESVSSGSAQP